MLARQVRPKRKAGVVEPLPVGSFGQRGNGDELTLIERGERSVDHLLGSHDDLGRQVVDRKTGTVPELGAGGAGENCLYLDTLAAYLVMKRLGEIDHIGFGAAIGAVEQLRCESNDGSDI